MKYFRYKSHVVWWDSSPSSAAHIILQLSLQCSFINTPETKKEDTKYIQKFENKAAKWNLSCSFCLNMLNLIGADYLYAHD